MPKNTFAQTPYINRIRELEACRERLDQALGSMGSIMLLAGQAGIGKSRLLEHVFMIARERRFCAVLAACRELVSAPFGPITDLVAALDAYDGSVLDDRQRLILDGIAVGEEKASGSAGPLNSSLAAMLRKHSQRRPLLLGIEDVQWADRATLDFICYMAPFLESMPVVLMVTVRTDSGFAPGLAVSGLSELLHSARDRYIILQPLDTRHSAQLAAATAHEPIEQHLIERIVALSEGNPLFVTELTRDAAIVGRGQVAVLPDTLRSTILRRLETLSATTMQFLTIASVVGRAFDQRFVTEIARVTREEATVAVLESVRHYLLRESVRDAHILEFQHEIVRQTIHGSVLRVDLRAINKAIGERLETEPRNLRNVMELAHHWAESGDGERTLRYSELAGDEALVVGAPSDAVPLFEQALGVVREPGPRRLELLRKLAAALSWSGRHDRALGVLQEALNYSRSIGHAPSIAEIALAIGTQLGNQPRTESVLASRLEALGAIPPGDDGVYLDALIGVADAYMNRGDAERALEFLARAEKGVNAAPYATRARYCMARGATYAVVGEPEAALQNIREAVACSEKTSDMKLPVWAQLNLCHYATMIGHVDVATASAASASPMALESGSSALVVYAHALAAEALFLGGDVALAAERTSMAIEAMRATEAARLSSLVAICALTTGRHRGKNAVPLLGRFDDDALLESAFRSEEPWWIGNLTAALIDWRMQSSSRQGLTLLLHRAVNSIASVALCPRLAFIVATIGSEGDIGRMRSLVARWAAGDGNEYGGACKALFEATLTAREGLPAEEAALAAAEAFAQQRIPLLRAKALEVAGRLDEAALEYQLCGAIADAKRLAPARAPIAPSATLRDTLSAREREVADVLLKGHSNREIADLLHISERTVESHVRTILSKAGVRSRFELAMALVEDGRFDGGGSADSVPAS